MQNLIGKNRHENGVRHAYQAHHAHQQQQGEDRLGAQHPEEALFDVLHRRSLSRMRDPRRDLHHQKTGQYGDVAHGIGKEAPAFTDAGYQNASDRRTDDARPIEHRGVESDRVQKVLLANHFDLK